MTDKIHKSTTKVGDVEVQTSIVVETTECEKLVAIAPKSQIIGEFLDWLQQEKRYEICFLDRYDRLCPVTRSISNLLAEYFEIDEKKLDDERRAILEAINR